jgi:hypothetical protein
MMNYTIKGHNSEECEECGEIFYDCEWEEMGLEDPEGTICPYCVEAANKRRLRKLQQSDSVTK